MALFSGIPVEKKKILFFMAMLNFAVQLGFQGWALLYNNFTVNEAGLNASQIGFIQGMREIPGFLGFTMIFFLFLFKEHRFAAVSVLTCGLGTLLTGFFPSYFPIICTSMLMSIGFHYFEALNNSLIIQHFNLQQTPMVMGSMRSLTACASLLVSLFVFFLSSYFSFKILFLIPGSLAVAIAFFSFFINPVKTSAPPKQKRNIMPQKRYWLFYVLNFFSGGRRIVFSVFAILLMVEQFGFSVRSVSIIFMFNYAVNWFFNPIVGKIINKVGEQKLLSLEYIAAILIFAGYAWSKNPYLIVLLYVFDSLTFNFEISVRTFFQKISFSSDAAPNMALAQTINHIAAVCIPTIGGWIWYSFGYQYVFIFGVMLSCCSLLLAQCISRELALKSVQH